MWYRNIATLPLNRFINVVVDGNFSALIISGFPSQVELQFAWSEIQAEYSDAIGNSEQIVYLAALKEITWMRLKLSIIQDSVEILRQVFHEPFANRLNILLNTSFDFDYSDAESYHEDLNKCIRRTGGLKIALDLKLIQFEELEKKVKGGTEKPSREYFQRFLITLSDFAKYPIGDSITVFEFCERVKRYSDYCDTMEKMNKKK